MGEVQSSRHVPPSDFLNGKNIHKKQWLENEMHVDPVARTSANSHENRGIAEIGSTEDKTEFSSAENPETIVDMKRIRLKIVIIGDISVGKTSILNRYISNSYKEVYEPTLGVDITYKQYIWDKNTTLILQFWDTAGEERTGYVSSVFYRFSDGVFIVYEIGQPNALENVIRWKGELDSKVTLKNGNPVPCILLANKCDNETGFHTRYYAAMDLFCKRYGFCAWFETSAKQNINLHLSLDYLVTKMMENKSGVAETLPMSELSQYEKSITLSEEVKEIQSKTLCTC